MKIYTKKGDQGDTCLVSGETVPKSHIRLESYGTLDELNSSIGIAVSLMNLSSQKKQYDKKISGCIFKIQNELFNLGSQLACVDAKLASKLPQVLPHDITDMESKIDELTEELSPLKNFILPGGSLISSQLHLSRTICRRAERICIRLREESAVEPIIIQYLNRLSDLLFVLARYANKLENISEVEWNKTSRQT